MAPEEDGHAIHYTAMEKGTPVYGSDDVEVGRVQNYGVRRFVDAPEVARTAERAVTLTTPAAEAAQLPPPTSGPGPSGKVRKLFGGLRRS